MTIRRVGQAGKTLAKSAVAKKGRSGGRVPGEEFAQVMDSLAPIGAVEGITATETLSAIDGEPTPRQRREQLAQTGVLLDSLEALGQDLDEVMEGDGVHISLEALERLRESRDEALRSLSAAPNRGEERDLLHRTAVLATVELAKTDRGDYK